MLLEFTPLQSRNMGSDSRITSGAVAMSDRIVSCDCHTAQFAGVDSTGVIATAGGCSPRMDSLAVNSNGHGVFGFDIFDIAPTNFVGTDGIYDENSIIANNQMWAMQDQIDCCGNSQPSNCCQYTSCDTAAVESFNSQTNNQKVGEVRSHNAAGWSKSLTVNHLASLTQGAKNV